MSGFTIEVRPEINPEYMNCFATVRSPKGDVIFEINDYGMDIASISGNDINGDGQPEAVIEAFSGGAHCCWTYYFVSLGQNPGLITKLENNHLVTFEDLNVDGVMEFLVRDGSFDYFHSSFVDSPSALLILRLDGKEFHDVGSEFRKIYDESISKSLEKLEAMSRPLIQEKFSLVDDSEARRKVTELTLEYLYSGRPEQAWKAFNEYWNAKDREIIRKEILEKYCHGMRARI
ncbi:MAG: hypothetical protein A3F68_07760 [Acidobacteria bacterium RIFCSPLOWO2_12_FULL_54_10]|nr:MAG: hypothetical protein A3F68_07760 [Acidobacteria bacterium RIFCSPLOWO2_12_FULL_54_10]